MKRILILITLVLAPFSWPTDIAIDNPEVLKELSNKDIDELHLVNQAMMYLLGQGVEKNPLEALRLFTISAKEGNQYAQANLGLMYAQGHEGIDVNYEEAIYWLRKASKQGNAFAQASLGYLYENGHGVEINLKEAYKLYKQSASQGNMLAHRNLGFLYKEGKGIPIDLVQSYMWFVLASSEGDKTSESQVFEIKGLLDDSQRSQAYEMGKECIYSSYNDCGYSTHINKYSPVNFVCDYQTEKVEPLTLQIDEETLRVGSLDVKHELKIIERNDSFIKWSDTSYMKLPFNVDHVLDLENQVLKFYLGTNETKLDCLEVGENEIYDYEKDMESVVLEEGWSPRLPTLAFYLKLAEDKDHPKVKHQMNLRCELLFYTKANALLSSFCPDLEVISEDSKIKQCMGDSNFTIWKKWTNSLMYHTNEHHRLNVDGSFLSDNQLNLQSSLIMKAYDKSFLKFLNKEEGESCWGDRTGLLCWEEEELMCGKLREEESMQAWFDGLTAK